MTDHISKCISCRNKRLFIGFQCRDIKQTDEIICSFRSYKLIIRITINGNGFDIFERIHDILEHSFGHHTISRSDSENILRRQRLICRFFIEFADQCNKVIYTEVILRKKFFNRIKDSIGRQSIDIGPIRIIFDINKKILTRNRRFESNSLTNIKSTNSRFMKIITRTGSSID